MLPIAVVLICAQLLNTTSEDMSLIRPAVCNLNETQLGSVVDTAVQAAAAGTGYGGSTVVLGSMALQNDPVALETLQSPAWYVFYVLQFVWACAIGIYSLRVLAFQLMTPTTWTYAGFVRVTSARSAGSNPRDPQIDLCIRLYSADRAFERRCVQSWLQKASSPALAELRVPC